MIRTARRSLLDRLSTSFCHLCTYCKGISIGRSWAFWSAVVICLIAVSCLGQRWIASASIAAPPAFQAEPKPPRPPMALITLRPDGFEPAEINVAKGSLVIVVENRTGLDSITLNLGQVAGARLKEVLLPLSKPDWNESFVLSSGRYALTEASHPDWVCYISVADQ
jgi:hypothetical protein